jgi:hypothetical protein
LNQAQLSKLWLVAGAILLYYTLDAWIIAQGGQALFGVTPIVTGKAPIAVTAIPICSVLLTLLSMIGWLYAKRTPGSWHSRIPIAWFDNIDTGSVEGRIYQLTMVFLFTVIPWIALAYFWWVLTGATIILKDGREVGMWSWPPGIDDPARVCTSLDRQLPQPCQSNATFIPLLEPALLLILTAMASVAMAMFLFETLRRPLR